MSGLDLYLNQETRLVLGQRMYQSMNILQMGSEELESFLYELSMANPFLEKTEEKYEYSFRYHPSENYHGYDGDETNLPIPDKSSYTLKMFLNEQLQGMKLEPPIQQAVSFLIINLDDKGFLPDIIFESSDYRKKKEIFDSALAILRNFEPAGVGAVTVSECLCLQLKRAGETESTAYRICRDYLEHLARNHYNHIAKALNLDEAEIEKARKRIEKLNPVPSNGFDDGNDTIWVIPDVEIHFENGEPVVIRLDRYMPRYELNEYYEQLMGTENMDVDDRSFCTEKIEEAKWALNCVTKRYDTIAACAEQIAEEQKPFFEHGENIRPCTMIDIANRMGVHPSTVSRTVKNKYIRCSRGIFPMSYFFAQDVEGETQEGITIVIKKLISQEDKEHPLSDSAICSMLSQEGIEIARRTVAKYREAAGLAPATGRKIRTGSVKK